MRCVLPNLGTCDVLVVYGRDETNRPVLTTVEVFKKEEDGTEVCVGIGEAMCHEKDTCVKAKGRSWALKRLFKDFPLSFSKEDRTVLFSVVCPKMFPRNKVNTLANRGRPGYRWLQAKMGY